MKVTVTLSDPEDTLSVDTDGRDRRAFERMGAKAIGLTIKGDFAEAIKAQPESYLVWLCWHAAKRNGLTAEPFDDFDARVTDMSADTDDGDIEPIANPTPKARKGI